ncbi:MAG TPA: DUF881 domain-containing protein [Acidimicrobiales bacterium]|nr:DUF881 domain-containing protein [Acidimicrobiales bacterium]
MPRSRSLLAVACVLMGFVLATAVRARPADPEARLPQRYRLVDLIEREERTAEELRARVADLRERVARLRADRVGQASGSEARDEELRAASLAAGLVPLRGPGLRVVLDDSDLPESPSGNVNDLVIHSQDVQGVVNALWKAGAEAMAINGQRLVGTSAVLCVGNTLLLNGTVHSPPYEVVAVGAVRDRFDADRLVRRLHADAKAFALRFSVARESSLEVPAYEGATNLRYARPAA